jgi:hypothetical protein
MYSHGDWSLASAGALLAAFWSCLQLGQTLDGCWGPRGWRPTSRRSLPGEVAAVGEDPGDAVAPVLAADEEAGEVLDVARVVLRDLRDGRVELVERRRLGDAGFLPHVLAHEHVPRAEVVGQRVLLAVDRPGVDEGLEQLVATEGVVLVGDVEEGADVGERGALGVAQLDDVRGVRGIRQGGRQLGDEVTPRLLLDLQGRAGVGLERVREVGRSSSGVSPPASHRVIPWAAFPAGDEVPGLGVALPLGVVPPLQAQSARAPTVTPARASRIFMDVLSGWCRGVNRGGARQLGVAQGAGLWAGDRGGQVEAIRSKISVTIRAAAPRRTMSSPSRASRTTRSRVDRVRTRSCRVRSVASMSAPETR